MSDNRANPVDIAINMVQDIVGEVFSSDAREHWAAVIEQAERLGIDASELLDWFRRTGWNEVIPPEMHEAMRKVGGRIIARQGVVTQLVAMDEFARRKEAGEDPDFPAWAFRRVEHSPVPASPDGPLGTDRFRWDGCEHEGLGPRAYRLIEHLWRSPERTSTIDDAHAAVYGDDIGPEDGLHGCRRDANAFFNDAKLPFSISISSKVGRVSLKKTAK